MPGIPTSPFLFFKCHCFHPYLPVSNSLLSCSISNFTLKVTLCPLLYVYILRKPKTSVDVRVDKFADLFPLWKVLLHDSLKFRSLFLKKTNWIQFICAVIRKTKREKIINKQIASKWQKLSMTFEPERISSRHNTSTNTPHPSLIYIMFTQKIPFDFSTTVKLIVNCFSVLFQVIFLWNLCTVWRGYVWMSCFVRPV